MVDFRQTHVIPRDLLQKYFGDDPRLVAAFENQALAVMDSNAAAVGATEAIDQATVITLSANAGFANEFVLTNGDGTLIDAGDGTVKISVDSTVARAQNFRVSFIAPADVTLSLPPQGTLISDISPATLSNKTLAHPVKLSGYLNAANDAAASAAGVPVGGIYHNAGALRVRLV